MSDRLRSPSLKGAALGLGAACLFAASVPVAKALLADMHPFVLAGLFYLGSGCGLSTMLLVGRRTGNLALSRGAPRKADLPWLFSAIFMGGVFAALMLMNGLTKTPAANAALLLNMEGVFTALIAWIVFREPANWLVACGLALLTLGAVVLSVGSDFRLHLSLANLCVLGASFGWAVDNNLTRRISHTNPVIVAAIKGLVAGSVNMSIGLALGGHLPPARLIVAGCLVGFVSYGLGLVLSILSMRYVGAARASAYFCTAPFMSAALAIMFFHEPLSASFLTAAALMAGGISLYLYEHHEHQHVHQPLIHEHEHVHDEHHLHEHSAGDPPGEPHCHEHAHEPLIHSHPHQPDIHHQHEH